METKLITPKYKRDKKGLPGKSPMEFDLFEQANIFIIKPKKPKKTKKWLFTKIKDYVIIGNPSKSD